MAGQAVAGIRARMVKQRAGKTDRRMTGDAILIVRCCRDVIRKLPYADPVVVTGGASIHDAGMVIGSGTECTRCMANTAILAGRHVGIVRGARGHTACRARSIRHMTGDTAIIHDARMVDAEGRTEAQGVVAETAIGTGWWMSGHCIAFSECVNTVGIIVAGFTRLYR